MNTIHSAPNQSDRIEQKLDGLVSDMENIKGQFEVISPKDMAALQVKVGKIETRTAPISAAIGAIMAGAVALLFRGGHA